MQETQLLTDSQSTIPSGQPWSYELVWDSACKAGDKTFVQRSALGAPLPCSPGSGTQALPLWQEDTASKPPERKTACHGVKCERLWFGSLCSTKAIQAACSCVIDWSLVSICSSCICVSLLVLPRAASLAKKQLGVVGPFRAGYALL